MRIRSSWAMKQSVPLASGAADCLATRSHCYPVQLHRALFPTGPSTSDGPLIPETCSTNSEDIAESHSLRTHGCLELGIRAGARRAKPGSQFDRWHSRLDRLHALSDHR